MLIGGVLCKVREFRKIQSYETFELFDFFSLYKIYYVYTHREAVMMTDQKIFE